MQSVAMLISCVHFELLKERKHIKEFLLLSMFGNFLICHN